LKPEDVALRNVIEAMPTWRHGHPGWMPCPQCKEMTSRSDFDRRIPRFLAERDGRRQCPACRSHFSVNIEELIVPAPALSK
jgi:hypothetical protein